MQRSRFSLFAIRSSLFAGNFERVESYHGGPKLGVIVEQIWRGANSERRMSEKTDPRGRVQWAVNEPVLYGGNPPQLFRHLRMAEHRTPNRIRVEFPVHWALVQKTV